MRRADILRAAALHAATLLPAAAEPCRTVIFERVPYTVCEAVAGNDVRVFHSGPDGTVYGSFDRVAAAVAATGGRLAFAMNGGMYHADRSPVGLLIENGEQRAPAVTAAGPGNFGMLPNGIFCVTATGFAVIETRRYAARPPACRHATQSGPMLVIGGALHPRFIPGSPSRFIRNGVGVSADGGRVAFVISGGRVSFDEFARLFRDGLGMPDALYFDGNVSRLYAPGIGRSDAGFRMGPIVGLVLPD
jgi:uncharacterized protein YigE (DUF2233 family)